MAVVLRFSRVVGERRGDVIGPRALLRRYCSVTGGTGPWRVPHTDCCSSGSLCSLVLGLRPGGLLTRDQYIANFRILPTGALVGFLQAHLALMLRGDFQEVGH